VRRLAPIGVNPGRKLSLVTIGSFTASGVADVHVVRAQTAQDRGRGMSFVTN
jgi:hypothetical protein